jgi:hypothetical protein
MRNDEVKMAKENFKSFLDVCNSKSLNLIKKSINDNNIILDEFTERQIIKIISIINSKNNSNPISLHLLEWEFQNLRIPDVAKVEILNNAILDNHLEIVQYILNNKLNSRQYQFDYNIFCTICCRGFLDMAKSLINYYVNVIATTNSIINGIVNGIVNFNDIILEVSKKGHLEIIKYLFELNEKYSKDYYRINHIENIIIISLQNNHPTIAEWVLNTFTASPPLSKTLDRMLKSILQECIITNSLNATRFIVSLYNTYTNNETNEKDLELLKILGVSIFNIYNIRLNLSMLQYLFNTFLTTSDIEEDDCKFIKTVSIDLERYKNILSRIDTKLATKEKLEWLSSLSNKYEIVFNTNNDARITIITPVILAIRNGHILEACNLLHLNRINTTTTITTINVQCECNICLDTKSHSIITSCSHQFCLPCIYEWLVVNGNRQCPYCRDNVILEECKYCIAE